MYASVYAFLYAYAKPTLAVLPGLQTAQPDAMIVPDARGACLEGGERLRCAWPQREREMAAVPALPFGTLLKRYRVAAGLTQEALAAEAGLSRQGIADLERGARKAPRKETVHLLAEAL